MSFNREDFLKRHSNGTAQHTGSRRAAGPTQNIRQVLGGSIIGAAKMTRLEESWASMPWTADAYIYQHWQTLCARSRIGCEDYDHLRKFLQLLKDNVPGPTGFKFVSCPLDNDGTVDRAAAKAIMRAYREWSKPVNFDFEGRLSRAEVERLAIASVGKDGEVVAHIRTGPDAGPWGVAAQLLDPMLLNPRHYEQLPNGNVVRHGIEFPKDGGRPVAYHFIQQDEMLMGYFISTRQNKRIPAEEIVHWFIPEIIGQKRGLPQTRTALWRMRMLSGFEDSALTNARVAASKMGLFRSEDGEEDIDADELPFDTEPGTFENIGNRELVPWNPQFPDTSVEPFCRSMLRSMAVGLLSQYHALSGDLTGVSFSSIRQGELDMRACNLAIQDGMEDGFCTLIFEKWLKLALLMEKIKLPNGKPLPWTGFDKFKDCLFIGRRWAWVDPSSEANAAQIMIGQKLRSRSEIIREIGDKDPETVWDEIEAEDKELKARNIVPLVPPGATPVLPPEAAGAAGNETGAVEGKKPAS